MSEPIEEGTVLGGRYRVTGLISSSEDQDLVLTGIDQVLNRQVSILVASQANAINVAESARGIAIGERISPVQVLDLGLSDGRTYLVANEIGPDQLLELVSPPPTTPYVEPFYTDTLGSEIFGESRQLEPEVYDDDEEYYGTLHAGYEDRGKRSLLDRFADRFSQRRSERAPGAAGVAGVAAGEALGPQTEEQSIVDAPVEPAVEVEEPVTEQTFVAPPPPTRAPSQPPAQPPAISDEPADQPPAAPVAEEPAAEEPGEAPADESDKPATAPVAAAAAAAPAAAAAGASARPSSTPPQDPAYISEEPRDREPSGSGRIVIAALVAIVAVVAVVMALMSLNNQQDPPVAGGETSPAPTAAEGETTNPEESSPTSTETEEPTVTPNAVAVSRVVPDDPSLNAEYDGNLPLIIDGNNATTWNSYTFSTSNFGGYASNMAFVVELEEESDVSEVVISQSGGSGGAMEVLVSDTPDLASANRITTTNFTGPEITVSVSEEGKPVKAQYVIVNVTELPQLQGGNRPFGMRIAEIAVS